MTLVGVYRSYARYVQWYQDFARTMGDWLRLPLSSAIIMIIILSRGLVYLARAK